MLMNAEESHKPTSKRCRLSPMAVIQNSERKGSLERIARPALSVNPGFDGGSEPLTPGAVTMPLQPLKSYDASHPLS